LVITTASSSPHADNSTTKIETMVRTFFMLR
jgi:hypothetical protein